MNRKIMYLYMHSGAASVLGARDPRVDTQKHSPISLILLGVLVSGLEKAANEDERNAILVTGVRSWDLKHWMQSLDLSRRLDRKARCNSSMGFYRASSGSGSNAPERMAM